MLIGILSDSHGQHLAVGKALALFDEHDVEYLIHCGDVGGMEVFDQLINRPCTFVWGNCDMPGPGIEDYLRTVGLSDPTDVPTHLELDGKRIAVFHGHEKGFDLALRTLDVDYIFHGHTHTRRDERFGKKRIINPGALHRARPKTVAILDTITDELRVHEIADD